MKDNSLGLRCSSENLLLLRCKTATVVKTHDFVPTETMRMDVALTERMNGWMLTFDFGRRDFRDWMATTDAALSSRS